MELTLVSDKLAKKIKELGFNEPTDKRYKYSKIKYTTPDRNQNNHFEEQEYSAPSLEFLKQWYREEHDIIIEPSFYDDPKSYECDIWTKENKWNLTTHCKSFKTYEDALDAGLIIAGKYLSELIG